MKRPLPNSYWVEPGRWLAGEHPAGESAADTRKRLKLLLAAGIDTFIDLTEPDECPPYDKELPAGVQYQNFPIHDHGVPAQPATMLEVLAALQAALSSDRRVYLHCRAGIGRTGMTVGCHLGMQAKDGERGLARLNELWKQCARSGRWREVPETDEQVAYVREWPARAGQLQPRHDRGHEPLGDAELVRAELGATRRVRERFLGALLGLATGDALAAATQYRRPGSFTPVGDLLGGGPFNLPRGAWSDDTAMALCLAESLVEKQDVDARDQMERYRRWQQEAHLTATDECVGITPTVARALALSQWRRQPHAGSHDPKQLDPEALVRAAPVAMFRFGDPEQVMRDAAEAARPTHQAPLVLDACSLFALMVHAALCGQSRPQVLASAAAQAPRWKPEVQQLAALIAEPARLAAPPARGSNVLDALQAATWAFATSRDFRDGALKAVNLGGDADVVGSAYGQLAGAFYGVSAIPSAWRQALLRRPLIEELADRLLAHALAGLAALTEPARFP